MYDILKNWCLLLRVEGFRSVILHLHFALALRSLQPDSLTNHLDPLYSVSRHSVGGTSVAPNRVINPDNTRGRQQILIHGPTATRASVKNKGKEKGCGREETQLGLLFEIV